MGRVGFSNPTPRGYETKTFFINQGEAQQTGFGLMMRELAGRTTPGPSLQKGGEPCPAASLTVKQADHLSFFRYGPNSWSAQPKATVPLLFARRGQGWFFP
jgi:hypothetical protein